MRVKKVIFLGLSILGAYVAFDFYTNDDGKTEEKVWVSEARSILSTDPRCLVPAGQYVFEDDCGSAMLDFFAAKEPSLLNHGAHFYLDVSRAGAIISQDYLKARSNPIMTNLLLMNWLSAVILANESSEKIKLRKFISDISDKSRILYCKTYRNTKGKLPAGFLETLEAQPNTDTSKSQAIKMFVSRHRATENICSN